MNIDSRLRPSTQGSLLVEQGGHRKEMSTDRHLSTQVHPTVESLVGLRADWDALLADFPGATPFSTLEWLLPWWRAFGGNDLLQVLTFRDVESSLVGIAPLSLSTLRTSGGQLRLLRFLGDGSHDSDNLDLPVRAGYEEACSHSLLSWLDSEASGWDICQLRTLPALSPLGNRLLQDLQARRWNVFTSTRPQSVVELPQTWEAYLGQLSSKERGKVGLRSRRLEKKYRVEICKCRDEAELDPALQSLYELHARHWQARGLPGTLHVTARRQFYRELASLLLARQRLEFWLLKVDGKVVAAQFGLRHGSEVFSLQEGFDPEYSADSVGYVLRSQVLKNLIADGVRTYDFLGGADDSKLRWGAEVRHYLNLEFARPGTRGSVCLSLKHKGQAAKAWLRDKLPDPVRRMLKRVGGRPAE